MQVFFLGLLVLFSWMATADHYDGRSFTDLANSSDVFASESDAAAVESALWSKYREASRNDSQRKSQHDRRELRYGDKVMKFSLDRKGEQPAAGYPVYIALHGGGGAPASVNDSQWNHMKVYYKESVKNGIYIAPRGISDTWNLHFRDESYPLYDRLIENLIAYENADPNRIYLLGFSAGGDGVYQIVPRMPDRFAAANMSAGHHNWMPFDNLLNTPFLLQVGEKDDAYNRNKVAAENFKALNELEGRHGGYVHDLFIHYDVGHNGWYDNDPRSAQHSIIKDPIKWLNNRDRTTIQVNTNAVDWLKKYTRTTLPTKLVWNLGSRAPRTQTWGKQYVDANVAIEEGKDLYYWLALDNNNVAEGRIEAEIKSEDNAIFLNHVEGVTDLRILLHRDLIDFSKPVSVYLQGQKILQVTAPLALTVMTRTLLERGDPALMFHGEIAVHLPNARVRDTNNGKFSYCSKGNCSVLSADHFRRVRQFPLDIAYTCKHDNQYALTFDDGPTDKYPELLEILDRHQVPATFFVVGKNLESETGKELIRTANNKGHEIANHTLTHASLVKLSDEQIAEQLVQTQNAILEALGDSAKARRASSIVRPPFGDIDDHVQNVAANLGFVTVRWNSDRYDWELAANDGPMVVERVRDHLNFVRNLTHNAANRSILDVNHDKSLATLSALDEIIPLIKDSGYQFVTVSDCLGLNEPIR